MPEDLPILALGLVPVALMLASPAAAWLPGDPPLSPSAAKREPAAAVISRATGGTPTRRLVTAVAANARPLRFTRSQYPSLDVMTGRAFIEQICGSVQDGYVDALRSANPDIALDIEQLIGARAYDIEWPACLFAAEDSRPASYIIQAGDTASDIMRRFTGTTGTRETALLFVSTAAGRNIVERSLRVGMNLSIPVTTLPTVLIARSGSSLDLATQLDRAGGARVATSEIETGGEIIVAAEVASAKGDEAGEVQCEGGDPANYPFDPVAVASAYERARQTWAELGFIRQTVHVVIVDNGFFGVPCTAGNCPMVTDAGVPAFSDRFPRPYFDAVQYPLGVLGPVPPTRIFPVNYSNPDYRNAAGAANLTSGHGTHVAGIAIGGPAFVPERSVFNSEGAVWLKLVIANLSAGRSTFPAGAELSIANYLGGIPGQKIVNLSLTIDASVHNNVSENISRMVGQNADSLFVVAAGNQGKDLGSQNLYPARLGGEALAPSNLISVASVDGSRRLSSFSNWSGRFVDIAAPGCRILSWLDAETAPAAASGTSQAAPIVSFAAALLRSVWDKPPPQLKSRFIYSGRLLPNASDRQRISGGTALNIVQALMVRDDIVTFLDGTATRSLIGRLSAPPQGLGCIDSREFDSLDLRSLKREGDTTRVFWRVAENQPVDHCDATVTSTFGTEQNQIEFTATHEIIAGQIVPLASIESRPIYVNSILDLVRREPDPSRP